jgi:hypothetical protein
MRFETTFWAGLVISNVYFAADKPMGGVLWLVIAMLVFVVDLAASASTGSTRR